MHDLSRVATATTEMLGYVSASPRGILDTVAIIPFYIYGTYVRYMLNTYSMYVPGMMQLVN